MDIFKVMRHLPHRYPFLLIDRVIEVDLENKRLKAIKNVTINEPFFGGHFPHYPVMPGVLILEAMAQASSLLFTYPNGDTGLELGSFFGMLFFSRKVRFFLSMNWWKKSRK